MYSDFLARNGCADRERERGITHLNCLAFHVDLVFDREGVVKSKTVYTVHEDHQEDSCLMIHSERWYPFQSKVSW